MSNVPIFISECEPYTKVLRTPNSSSVTVALEVIQRYVFTDFLDAKLTFEAHREWYNHSRKHGSIGRVTPQKKWDVYEKKKVLGGIMFALLGKAETGNAGEQPVRNNPTNENDPEKLLQVVSSGSLENHFCSHT